MWVLFACGSAFFAGVTSILAKCGIRKTDSTTATAIRTIIVWAFSWLMVFFVGSQSQISQISGRTWLFLVLSGLATGASWLCYFRALQLGDINKVVPIDKSSVILTILLACILLREPLRLSGAVGSWLCYFRALQLGDINKVVPIDKSSVILTILLACILLREPLRLSGAVGVVSIAAGTYLMIERRSPSVGRPQKGEHWLLCAVGSAVFASLTSILGKVGISGIESNLGTAIRTGVVLIMAWLMSWLCYFRALQLGDINKVVPIDKSSVILTILLACILLREPLRLSGAVGSAVFASLTSILGKVGISGIESNLGTAIRTGVVLIMAWLMVLTEGKTHTVKKISPQELGFICLSGVTTGASWLCYYRALQNGPASIVVPIDKLSILVTVAFSYFVFHEKLSKKAAVGLGFIVSGTLIMLLP